MQNPWTARLELAGTWLQTRERRTDCQIGTGWNAASDTEGKFGADGNGLSMEVDHQIGTGWNPLVGHGELDRRIGTGWNSRPDESRTCNILLGEYDNACEISPE